MSDIKVQSGEIEVYEDLLLVEGNELLKQDILNLLKTELGSLFYNSGYGSSVIRYIQGANDSLSQLALIEAVKSAVAQDDRINSYSVSVEIYEENSTLVLTVICETKEGELLEVSYG